MYQNIAERVICMGFRFHKSIKLGKHTRLNFSKSGVGISTGVKGLRTSIGPRGTRVTASIPGSGLSYQTRIGKQGNHSNRSRSARRHSAGAGCTVMMTAYLFVIVSLFFIVGKSLGL